MRYKRPPIIEAVMEFRFAQPASQAAVDEAAKRSKRGYDYFYSDPENVLEFSIDTATTLSSHRIASTGIKLSSLDRADLLIFRTNAFVCSRLAPYSDFESFVNRAKKGWADWRSASPSSEITRIGLRFLNRIDIPDNGAETISLDDYLKVGLQLPDTLQEPWSTYTMQIVYSPSTTPYTIVLNSGTLQSPLVGFTSLLLDIDVGRDKNLPRRDDAIWETLEEMRVEKNRVFESCITDLSRTLFNS